MAKGKAKSRSKAKAAKKPAPKRAGYKLAPHAKGHLGVPEGFSTLTAHLVVDGAAEAMDFYKRAFGAQEIGRAPMPDSKKLMHGLMRVGDSMLMLVDAFPEFGAKGPKELGGSPVTLHLYTKDADSAFKRAV